MLGNGSGFMLKAIGKFQHKRLVSNLQPGGLTIMRSEFAFGQLGAASRRKGALALCLTLCTLGLGLSANGQNRKATIITVDAPGAFEGTFPQGITPAGAIT